MRLCSAPRCKRRHRCLGYCNKHYNQVRRLGRTLGPDEEYKRRGRRCAHRGCPERLVGGYAADRCPRHYRARRMRAAPCREPGCDRKQHARRMCLVHYWRSRRRPRSEYVTTGCSILGCQKPHRARGLCAGHYARRWRQKNLLDESS